MLTALFRKRIAPIIVLAGGMLFFASPDQAQAAFEPVAFGAVPTFAEPRFEIPVPAHGSLTPTSYQAPKPSSSKFKESKYKAPKASVKDLKKPKVRVPKISSRPLKGVSYQAPDPAGETPSASHYQAPDPAVEVPDPFVEYYQAPFVFPSFPVFIFTPSFFPFSPYSGF